MDQNNFYQVIRDIVQNELKKSNLQTGQWHLGTINQVKTSKLLSVFVDGSTTAQDIPCNPDVTFTAGSKVFVLYVNGDTKNKFVPFKRGI